MTALATHTVDVAGRPAFWRGPAAAVVVLGLGLGGSLVGHWLVPQVGLLTWGICLGTLVGNIGVLPRIGARHLALSARSSSRSASSYSASRRPSPPSPRSASR